MTRPPSLARTVGVPLAIVGAALGTILWSMEAVWYATQGPVAFLLALILATGTAAPYTLTILWLDRHEKEPPALIAGTFLWGALACTAFAGMINTASTLTWTSLAGSAEAGQAATIMLTAPVVEELLKSTALFVLFHRFRHHTDGMLDGLIYGAVVGMGFAWFENATYYLAAFDQGWQAVAASTWARGFWSGVGTHATFTALTGIGFGYERARPPSRIASAAPWLGLGIAMIAHAVWNTGSTLMLAGTTTSLWLFVTQVPIAVMLLQLPFTLLVLAVAVLTWRHQDELIRTHLADEPHDVIRPPEIARLVPARRRLASGWRATFSGGIQGWWAHRKLTQALVRIAFERWHWQREHPEATIEHDRVLLRLRERVRTLRSRGVRV